MQADQPGNAPGGSKDLQGILRSFSDTEKWICQVICIRISPGFPTLGSPWFGPTRPPKW
jgi:hypothetical protein